MERTVDIATGESVAFTYELAGLGSRFYAVFIDLAIQLAAATSGIALVLWLAAATAPHGGTPVPAVGKLGRAFGMALVYVAAFALFFGYFIVFEWLWEGRTPGKRLLGIRVVRDGGFPLDFTSAVVRNVVRMLEFGAGFYAISAVAALLSPSNRRLGDMAAGTIVVRENRFERTPGAFASSDVHDDALHDDLALPLSQAERDLIRRYAARRPALAADARAAIAAQIGASVRPKLQASFAHLGDDDLLVHLARTALARNEKPAGS